MKIFAQLFGIGAMICLFLIYQQKTRKRIILLKLCTDVCWVLHYLMLGGVAGMIPNFIGIFREIIFIHRKDKKWAGIAIWPALFIIINWCWGFTTFSSLFNILPIAASTVVTVSLWIDNPKLMKIISIPVSLSFLIYDIFIGSYIGIINESTAICSIVISLISTQKQLNHKSNEEK